MRRSARLSAEPAGTVAGKLSWGLEVSEFEVLAIQAVGHLTFILRWVDGFLFFMEFVVVPNIE